MTLKNAFISGIAAGIMVGIGGAGYMSCDNKYVGASFFSVALLSICYLGMYLYTGRIGYLAEKFEVSTLPVLGLGLVGNFVGATAFGLLCTFARPAIVEKAQAACASKIEGGCLKAVILGAMCGILMYVAVKIFKEFKTPMGVLFCIPVFILSGFEHSIADMYYFALAGSFSLNYLWFILSVVLGNTIGAMGICYLIRFSSPKKSS
jgi:formate/nitrite transporter